MKKQGIKILKKKLWKEFALWVKWSRSDNGWVNCFTCGASLQIGTSNCQAGHWLAKSGAPIHYFEPDMVRPQCFHCNVSLSGNSEVFRRNLIDDIGIERVEELYETRSLHIKRSIDWYLEMIKKYKGLNEVFQN